MPTLYFTKTILHRPTETGGPQPLDCVAPRLHLTPARQRIPWIAHSWQLALAGVAALSLLGCHKEETASTEAAATAKVEGEKISLPANAPQRSSLAVETAAPRPATVARFTGRLIWNDEVTVRIFSPVAGRVHNLPVNLGQLVGPGDALAKIVSPDFGQAQADLRKASSDLQLAERTLTRVRELFEHGAAARKDVDAAEGAQASTLAEKERATARLSLYGGGGASVDQMFTLKTPLGGVVVEKNVNPGQEVRPDQMLANAPILFAPLFVISDPTRLWLLLDVSELDMTALKPGLDLKIHTKAFPDKIFEGRVEVVGDSLDATTRTVKVRCSFNNSEKLLKAEMYVTADVTLGTTENGAAGVDVSAKAVFLKDNRHYVFIEHTPGQYERRAVKPGAEASGKILVLEGLEIGQKVVTQGCLLLQAMMESGG